MGPSLGARVFFGNVLVVVADIQNWVTQFCNRKKSNLIRTKKKETRRANVKKKTKKKKKSIVPWACAVQEGVDSEWQMLKLFINSMLLSLAGYGFLCLLLRQKGSSFAAFVRRFSKL